MRAELRAGVKGHRCTLTFSTVRSRRESRVVFGGVPIEADPAVGVGRERLGSFSATSVGPGVASLPDFTHVALVDQGGDVVVAEASAGGQGHELLGPRDEPFYAHAVTGSSVRRRIAPTRRTYACSKCVA